MIKDDICSGRPDWDQAGATFSANVHEYEAMKIRILNGGHQIRANVGEWLAADASVEGLALVESLWARMCEGTREDGTTIEPNDPHWAELQSAASAARSTPGLNSASSKVIWLTRRALPTLSSAGWR